MTNEVLVNQNQASTDAGLSNAGASQEYMTQDKANYLITKAKESAYERGRQEALATVQSAGQPLNMATLTEAQIIDLIDKRSDEKVTAKVQALAQEQSNANVARQIVSEYAAKMAEGRKEYDDFDEVVGAFNIQNSPQMVALVNSVPGTEHCMYEMGQHPEKFSDIENLLRNGHRVAAERAMKKLSDSILKNKEKAQTAQATKEPKPLSQLKSSTASVDGSSTVPMTQKSMKDAIRALRKY
jgi:hypothetical protein